MQCEYCLKNRKNEIGIKEDGICETCGANIVYDLIQSINVKINRTLFDEITRIMYKYRDKIKSDIEGIIDKIFKEER